MPTDQYLLNTTILHITSNIVPDQIFEVNPDPDPIPLTQTIPCIYQINNAISLTVNPDPVLRQQCYLRLYTVI